MRAGKSLLFARELQRSHALEAVGAERQAQEAEQQGGTVGAGFSVPARQLLCRLGLQLQQAKVAGGQTAEPLHHRRRR